MGHVERKNRSMTGKFFLRSFVFVCGTILLAASAARPEPVTLTINLLVENRTIIIYAPDGGGLIKDVIYEIYSGNILVAKTKIEVINPRYAKGSLIKVYKTIVEGNPYEFLIAEVPKPIGPPGSDEMKKTTIPTPEKESADTEGASGKTERRKKSEGKEETGKEKTGGEDESASGSRRREKIEDKQETGESEKKTSSKQKPAGAPAPPWHETPDTGLANVDGATGLVLLPAARSIGHYGTRATLSWGTESFTSGADFLGGPIDVDDSILAFNIGYGLTDNVEFDFAYQKDSMSLANSLINESQTFITHRTSLKYTFPGDWPGRSKTALIGRYENTNSDGDQTDSFFAAAAIDHQLSFMDATATGMYGYESAGDHNIIKWGAGFEARVHSRVRASLEYVREVSPSSDMHDLEQIAIGGQYRLESDWSCSASLIFSSGGYWDTNSTQFRLGAIYHPKWRD